MGLTMLPLTEHPHASHQYMGHTHFWERAMARRQFIRTATGSLCLVLGAGLWLPKLARAAGSDSVAPNPIPGGIQPFGPGTEVFHFFLPTPPGPGMSEPSTITDFHGFVGFAHVIGNGTRTNLPSGTTQRVFFDTDMRFMHGHYVGVDGRPHNGTFGFFWLDLFESQGGSQLASIDPGNAPGGLFWTIPIPSDSVQLALGAGSATYALDDVATKDFGNIVNDLQHGSSVPVTASFRVEWSGKTNQFQVRDEANGFRGEYVQTSAATIEWSSSEATSEFVSDPAATSTSLVAALGQEHNGVFF